MLGGSADNTTAKAADHRKFGNPDRMFVHLDDIDHAGHSSGSVSAEHQIRLNVTAAKDGKFLAEPSTVAVWPGTTY